MGVLSVGEIRHTRMTGVTALNDHLPHKGRVSGFLRFTVINSISVTLW